MLNFRARPGQKRVIAENTVQESCPETGIHTNRKTCTPSPKDWGRKVLSKVWGLQPSFQWIQDCLHQALFLQSVNHSSLSENHWDHSAVGISDTSNAKNTKKLQSQPCAVSSEPDCCIACIYRQRAGAGADTFQISLFKSAGLGPLSKNPPPSPFIPNSKYLTSPPGLTNNGSL